MHAVPFTLTLCCIPLLASELTVQVAQRAVRDWREGELSALEVRLGTLIEHKARLNNFEFTSTITATLGIQSLDLADSLPVILLPTTNDLRTDCTFRYRLGWMLDPTVTLSLVTQPTESFRLNGLQRIRTAKFLDPVCTQQTFSIGYASPPPPHFFIVRVEYATWHLPQANACSTLYSPNR